MSLFSRHLDAAALGLAVLGDAGDTRSTTHLASCARCRRERDRIARLLDDARAGAADAADAAFGPAELERQQQAILQRIARTGGVARVLHFPHAADERPHAAPRADARWLLVAAAAGLVIGVAAGQLPYRLNAPREATGVARAVPPAAVPPALDRRAEDTLLSEVETALDNRTRPELEVLDALTPVHYETR